MSRKTDVVSDLLIEYCEEMIIRIDQSIRDGKMLANLETIKDIYRIQVICLKHLMKNSESDAR